MSNIYLYTLFVGNIGLVYHGTNGFKARIAYNCFRGASKRGIGRAAGEAVTLFRDDEILLEYIPEKRNEE